MTALVTFPTWSQATLRTTDNAWNTIATIPVPMDTAVSLRIVVTGHATDLYIDTALSAFGQGGWVDVGGIATLLGSNADVYTNGYNWDVRFIESGSNILVQVNGETGVNISWSIRWAVDQVSEV